MTHVLNAIQTKFLRRIRRNSMVVMAATAIAVAPLASTPVSAATPSINAQVGSVISASTMTLPAELRSLATGKKITYVSTDIQNQKIVVSGAVITPKVQPREPKVVAWGHGSTGLADQCAPSKNLNLFWPEAVAAVKSYLQKGWTVAATDYPGLGTAGAHPYLVGESEARAVIDSVRAARKLDAKLTSNWVAVGHSEGGQAALFAGEIADTYGGGLKLKGVVGISPVSNGEIIASMIAGTPGQGYLVMALSGLAAVDSSVNMSSLLAQPAKDRLGVLTSGCLEEILYTYAPLTAEELLVGGQLPDAVIAKLAASANPAQQASTVPILLVQGTADQDVPADLTYLLQSQMYPYGIPTFLHVVEGADHITTVIDSTDFVRGYITDRFLGLSAPSN